jgi:hypothetical protein
MLQVLGRLPRCFCHGPSSSSGNTISLVAPEGESFVFPNYLDLRFL